MDLIHNQKLAVPCRRASQRNHKEPFRKAELHNYLPHVQVRR